ncbi:MAG TPA: MarR family transcriptional regulator [Candidatus Nanopelagicales bacterium]
MARSHRLSQQQYTDLLEFRTALRTFERWSADQARHQGLTPAQHQLLLAVKGHPDRRGPTVGEVASYLHVRHHSAVELIDRTVEAGFVERRRVDEDGRVVRLRLTRAAEGRFAALAELHLGELLRLTPILDHLAEPYRTQQRDS